MATSSGIPTAWGYSSGFKDAYVVLGILGKGGFGTISKVQHRQSGRYLACKMLPKELTDPLATQKKREMHSLAVRQEVIFRPSDALCNSCMTSQRYILRHHGAIVSASLPRSSFLSSWTTAQVEAMLLLRGALNVACLEEVYEDEQSVYLVMELCSGGNLNNRMRSKTATEIKVLPPGALQIN